MSIDRVYRVFPAPGEEWDEGVAKFLIGPLSRMILVTQHGELVIDIRERDVNAYTRDAVGYVHETTLLPLPRPPEQPDWTKGIDDGN